jgi:hypothetical protein
MHCDYLLGFQTQIDKRISESILLWKWLRNASDVKDDAYETLVLAYNKKLNVLVLVSSITRKMMLKRRALHHT